MPLFRLGFRLSGLFIHKKHFFLDNFPLILTFKLLRVLFLLFLMTPYSFFIIILLFFPL